MLRRLGTALTRVGLMLTLGLAACTRDIPLPEVSPADAGGGGRDGSARDIRLVSPTKDASVDIREVGPDRSPDGDERCTRQSVTFQHPRVILAVDRSTSMQEKPAAGGSSRLHGVQHVLEALMRRYARAVYFGYVEFPVADCPAGSCCASRVVTPGRSTLGPIQRRWSCELEPASCQSTTKDSPIAEALMGSRREFESSDNDFDQRHVFLLTDGEPACSTSTMDDECLRSGQEISKLTTADVTTTVFALSDTLQTSGCLADLASGGGSGAPVFALTPEALKDRLEERVMPLAKQACTFRLDDSLEEPQRLRIWLNGDEVKRDPARSEGWEFEDGAPARVTFYGSWCTKLTMSMINYYEVAACEAK